MFSGDAVEVITTLHLLYHDDPRILLCMPIHSFEVVCRLRVVFSPQVGLILRLPYVDDLPAVLQQIPQMALTDLHFPLPLDLPRYHPLIRHLLCIHHEFTKLAAFSA